MTFLAGTFLSGLALAAVPVVIHLFARRKRQVVPWGAMQFLTGSPPRFRRRILRLNELLVLLLRILAVCALVLAFARPLVPAGVIPSGGRDVVFVIDASLSTARRVAERGTAFDLEIAAADKAVGLLGERDSARILLATDAPRWLTPAPLDGTAQNREALRAMLRTLKPTLGGSDLAVAIGEALQSTPAPNRTARQIQVFSDSTERAWQPQDAARWTSLARSIADAPLPTRIDAAVEIAPFDPAAQRSLSIDRLTPELDTFAAGTDAILTAEIRNRSEFPSKNTALVWSVDGREVGRTNVPPLNAKTSATVEFAMPFPQPGSFVASGALIAEDDLPLDDSAFVAIRVLDEIPILVVDGGDETSFLLAALGHSAFRPKVIAPAQFAALDLRPFVCVILANTGPLTEADAAKLAEYTGRGGGLWLALGPRTNVDNFNKLLSPTGAGLSPCRIAAAIGDDAAPWRILPPDQPHPATLLLRDTAHLDIDKARVARHLALAEPVPQNLTVLLALETQAPLVIEHPFGRGRVLLQTTPLDRAWSNLPVLHSYVPLVREFVWRMAEGRLSRRNLAPGDTLRLPLSGAADAPFSVRLPDGATFSGPAQDAVARFSTTFLPGIYDLEYGAQRPHEFFSVARPAAESDLTPLSGTARVQLEGHGVIFNGSKTAANGALGTTVGTSPIAFHLLALALALFLAEALAAMLLARRRNVRAAAATMIPVTTR